LNKKSREKANNCNIECRKNRCFHDWIEFIKRYLFFRKMKQNCPFNQLLLKKRRLKQKCGF